MAGPIEVPPKLYGSRLGQFGWEGEAGGGPKSRHLEGCQARSEFWGSLKVLFRVITTLHLSTTLIDQTR